MYPFRRALDAVGMTWDNSHLKNILASDTYTSSRGKTAHPSANTGALFNDLNQPLWKGKIHDVNTNKLL